uniref:Serpin domain-containing protein n=1 Tax=Leersia perrieri TaxID=77586 RepID=A0A0D9XQJ0_9ORYZ
MEDAGDSGMTAFALRLAKHLSDADAAAGSGNNKNIVFSPVSLYAALALVAAGARRSTLSELLALLGAASLDELTESVRRAVEVALADESASGGPRVAYACGVWHDEEFTLKPPYRDAAVESFKAEVCAANFLKQPKESRKKINKWVSKATKQLIPEILPEGSIHTLTALVLVNAIYFKANWSNRFFRGSTTTRKFYRLDGRSVLKLPYHQTNKQDGDQEQLGLSMCIFLPDAHDGLAELIDKMASSGTGSFLRDHRLKYRVEVGEFRVPRFKVSFDIKLKDVLKKMGVEAAFDEDKVDLSGMLKDANNKTEPLVVEEVFHKAVIEVNEEGTKAAASTACTVKLLCARRIVNVNFVADHPFAFFVVEETSGAVLFAGHVFDPTS